MHAIENWFLFLPHCVLLCSLTQIQSVSVTVSCKHARIGIEKLWLPVC